MRKPGKSILRIFSALLLTLPLLACAGGERTAADLDPPVYPADEFIDRSEQHPIEVSDPLEGFNRAVYNFNTEFDRFVFLPVVEAYQTVTPDLAQKGVSNFFSNITELITFANGALQLKPIRAGRAALRFSLNTILGLGGLIDIASEMGIQQIREDLGQTLGRYGVPGGPYLVLPIFGPSNLRDTVGLIGDTVAFALVDPFNMATIEQRYPVITGLRAVDTRSRINFRYWESGSPYEYDLVRLLYTKRRQIDIAQ
ncbi:MAG: VacJ family lipoprotein [Kiloniellales bacterium]|nr:VacJ family lipoprotein [Kiloniellales bacterium]